MRIVVVEDDSFVKNELRAIFRREFRQAQVDCYTSESEFQNCISGFEVNPPLLVVLDVMLPWGDIQSGTPATPSISAAEFAGIRCASALRALNLSPPPWIILYTVWPTDQMPADLTQQLKPLIIIDKDRGPRHVLKVAQSILRTQMPNAAIQVHEPDIDSVFVAMPFSGASEDTYEAIVRAVTRIKKGVRPYRVDTKAGSFPVVAEIERAIDSSWLVVCDLTEEKPNVYYELGYAIARGKRVICVAKEATYLHFDVAGRKVVMFRSYTHLEKALRQELLGILEEEHK